MNLYDYIPDTILSHIKQKTRHEHTHEQHTEEWTGSLENVAGKLNGLALTTEKEFLEIGEKLRDFYARAQEMARQASLVVDFMTGEKISQSTKGLIEILEELQNHLAVSERHFTKISDFLQKYLNTLRKVSAYMESFKMLVLNLSMLGFFTRVENAYVFSSDTGFASLTDDVKKLSSRIKDKTSLIKSKCLTLIELSHNAIADVADSKRSQYDQARIMLDNTISNHRVLTQKNDTATQSARQIAQRSQEITQSIYGIVSSLQFHDITRQQIDHVNEAIGELISAMESGEYPISDKTAMIEDVCSLQRSQLVQSREELFSAVTNVVDNLSKLSVNVAEILEETQKVAWASEIEGLTFMEEIDSGISKVIRCLDDNIREQVRLTGTIAAVSDMVSEMSEFVQEIGHLGQNLQLIALNARIKAAQIGCEGAALDTISGGIYDLSKSSRSDTKELSELLEGIVDIAKGFDAELTCMQESQEEQVHSMVSGLKEIIDSLYRVNDGVLLIINDMNNTGGSLVDDIKGFTGKIHVQKMAEKILSEAEDIMGSIVVEAARLNPVKNEDAKRYLNNLDKLYTMKSERDIHTKHVEEKHTPDLYQESSGSQDELGDNVELF